MAQSAGLTGIKKILFITLSNVGDAVLTLPAFDFVRRTCPEARITVVAGPRTRALFDDHPDVDVLVVLDKRGPVKEKIGLFRLWQRENFDVVIDLKDSFYRWGLKASRKNPGGRRYPSWIVHARHRHLYQAVMALRPGPILPDEFEALDARRNPSFIGPQDRSAADRLLAGCGLKSREPFVFLFPGGRSDLKKWSIDGFVEVAREVRARYQMKVILGGDAGDLPDVRRVLRASGPETGVLAGQTSLGVLAALLERSRLVIGNDSGVIHLASYLARPVVAVFGPTDERRYGPWSPESVVVRKHVLCAPCGAARCRTRERSCIETVRSFDVLLAVRVLLESSSPRPAADTCRRILVVRTDRMGDLLLTTPVLKALRLRFPASFIGVMAAAGVAELVQENPYVDRVIVVDKERRHRGFLSTLTLAEEIRRLKFDVAVILHPTLRAHLICFLAGIPRRIGYDRKAPYLLTEALPHTKQEGMKHELEYNFDLLKTLGVTEIERELTVPVRWASELAVTQLLREAGISPRERLVAIHPTASDLSRRWPTARYAAVIDRLKATTGVTIALIADKVHADVCRELERTCTVPVHNLCGRFTLSQLASFLRRCELVISTDSGPVHLAVAVGTPVISIFGRNQPGLSPRRWGPVGPEDVVLHKTTSCNPCRAHDCRIGFKCLDAVTVEEVVSHAERILSKGPVFKSRPAPKVRG